MCCLAPRFSWFSLLLAAGTLSACAGSHDDMTKRLAVLQTDISRLQSHSDRLEERLEALEMRKTAVAPGKVGSGPNESATVERPRLMIVKLEPGDEAQRASPDAPTAALRPEDSAADQSPRPVIRVYGSRTEVDPGTDSAKRKR